MIFIYDTVFEFVSLCLTEWLYNIVYDYMWLCVTKTVFKLLSLNVTIQTNGLTNIFVYTFNDILDYMFYVVSEWVRLNIWIFSHCVKEYVFDCVSHLWTVCLPVGHRWGT